MVAWPIDKNSGQSLIVFEKKCIYSYMQCEYKETLHRLNYLAAIFKKSSSPLQNQDTTSSTTTVALQAGYSASSITIKFINLSRDCLNNYLHFSTSRNSRC